MAIEAARLTVVVDASTESAERGIDNIGHKVNSAGGMVRDVAGTAFGFLSAQAVMGATAAGASMFRLGVETQDAMNIFQSVTGATGDTMARVSGLARDLGNDITLPGTSAKDATLAMVELAKAGLSVDQTMAAAKGTLQLAAAAGTDAGTAAQITANALNAFGLGGDQAVRVADLLAAAANSSSGEITDMASALQMSSAVYSSAGQSIESLTSAIGLMANKGIIGSDAGTSLKQMLLALESPTNKARDTLKGMGIAVYGLDGKMLPLRSLIEQFTAKTKDMTQAQRDNALGTIFGSDAIRAAQIVMTGGTQAFDEMTKAVTKQGAAQEVSAARMKGVGGAIEGLKSQVETVLIDAFNAAAPVMERVVRALSDNLPTAIAFVGRAFSAVRVFIAQFLEAFRYVMQTGSWEAHGFAEQIGVATARVVGWFREHWPQIAATVSEVMGTVREVIGAVVAWIAENWPQISSTVSQVLQTVWTVVTTILEAIAAFWRTWGGTILSYLEGTWNAVRQVITGAMEIIRGVIDVVMGLIRGDWSRVWDGIRSIIDGVWHAINGIIDWAINNIRTEIEIGMRLVAGVFDNIWDGIKSAASSAWDGLKSIAAKGLDALYDAILGLPGRIVGLAAWFLNSGKSLGSNLVDGILDGLKGVAAGAVDFAKAFGNAVVDVINEHIIDRINNAVEFSFDTHIPGIGTIHVNPPDVPHIPKFHQGGIVPGVGETLAMLQGGEGVFTREQMAALGPRSAGSSTVVQVTNHFGAGSVRSNRDVDRISAAVNVSVARAQTGRRLSIDARGFGY